MSRPACYTFAGALLFSFMNLPALAQGSETILAPEVERIDKVAKNTENGAVEATPQKSDVSIVAGKDKSTAKISLAKELCGGRLSASLATPVNTKDDATQFFTLEGPAEDVQLGIAWKKQSFNLDLLPLVDFSDLIQRRLDICSKFNVPQGTPCDDTQLENALNKAKMSPMAIAAVLQDFHAVKLPTQNRVLPLFRAIPFHYYGVTGSLGRTERKFFDLSATDKKEDRLSYSLGVTYGRVFQSSRWTASLATQRKYEEGKKARKCAPVEGSPTLEQCKELPLKEAAKVDSAPLTLEYRLWFRRTAVSPKVAYDFQRKVFAGGLPVYLFADADRRLTGGIRLDWEEGKAPSASVFVSSPLGLD